MGRAATRIMGLLAALVLGAASVAWAQSAPSTHAETQPAASGLHDQIIDQYMQGQWDSLQALLTQNAKQIAALPKDQEADVAYIKEALAECHPAWWNQTKAGAPMRIRPVVWKQSVAVSYQNAANVGMSYQSQGGFATITLTWPSAQMDNGDHGEAGFTKGDLANTAIWAQIDQASIWSGMSPERVLTIEGAEKTKFYRYTGFRSIVTAAYYGTPRAREWAIYLSLDGYIGDHTGAEVFIARRPFAAMFMAELAGHPNTYPDLRLPRAADPANAESRMAFGLMGELSRNKLSFAEDKALRAAIKQFATANEGGVFAAGRVTLPSKLIVELDPKQDQPMAAKRNQWLADAIANGGEPAAKPAEKPGG